MTDDKKKLPTPSELKQELQLSAKGEGQFVNEHGQPSGDAARQEWQRILSEMNNKGLSIIEKKSWIERFLDEVKGTGIVISFAALMKHINGQYKRLSEKIEGDELVKDNKSTDDQPSRKNIDPWDKLDKEVQNRITAFLSGKRKTNKPCYRYLLSCFESNRDIFKNKDATAVLDMAKENKAYRDIESKPTIKMLTEKINNYRQKHPTK